MGLGDARHSYYGRANNLVGYHPTVMVVRASIPAFT